MMNKSKKLRLLSFAAGLFGVVVLGAGVAEVNAQRDPFQKPGWAKTREQRGGTSAPRPEKKGPPPVITVGAPPIEQRIEYFMRLRESAAENGQPLPKVTSVLTLDEMAVTGIFRSPRGLSAIVEATPIKLSYTIYPGEKFFDGQLVAIEENKLVFKKVTKMSNNKFTTTVENKPLRQFTTKSLIEGTAPAESPNKTVESADAGAPPPPMLPTVKPGPIVSPVDEMNSQPEESETKAPAKKPTKRSGRKN